jgi:phytoene synthase
MSNFPSDRDLVRLHWPEELRPAFDALLGIDDALADAALKTREPQLAAIKLAWWREQLQALDVMPSPAEPRLEAAGRELLSRGITGAELAELEDGWLALLQPVPDPAQLAGRGEMLFGLAARLLGVSGRNTAALGRNWALADLARRTGQPQWLGARLQTAPVQRQLRPLTALTALAVRDHRRGFPLEEEAVPGRAWTLIRHRITGRV